MEQKIKLYEDNSIIEDGKISYSAIASLSYDLNMPYIIFNGGNKIDKELANNFKFEGQEKYALPTAKDDYRLMTMNMYYPDG
jgi:hypothetical protein